MQRVALILIIIATLLLAGAHALAGNPIGAMLTVATGLAWALALRRGRGTFTGFGMIGLHGAAVGGILGGMPPLFMVLGVVLALVAWDLDHAFRRLQAAGQIEDADGLLRARLRWLAPIALLGLGIGVLLPLVRVQIAFGWLLILGLAAALILSRILAGIQREG